MESFINFNNAYGDITFVGEDIELSRGADRKITQDIINLFKTTKGDYELSSDFGLDLDGFLGQPVSEDLAANIEATILKKLETIDVLQSTYGIEVLSVVENNTIYFRIIIPGIPSINIDFLQEKGFELE